MSINSNNFLEQFENQGFYFSKEMIFNFHNCLITKPFVILSGISGSGKSKLGQYDFRCNDKFRDSYSIFCWFDAIFCLYRYNACSEHRVYSAGDKTCIQKQHR